MNEIDDDRGAPSPLAALPRELPPPAGLEERVVARLAARGLLTRRRALRWLAPLAAALAGIAGGWLLRGGERAAPAGPVAAGELYLLLIEGEPDGERPAAELVASYRAWGEGLAARGQLAGAEKLADEGLVLAAGADGPAAPLAVGPETLGGFFLVRAASLAEAEAIARTSPHAKWGGRVTVRPIDPV